MLDAAGIVPIPKHDNPVEVACWAMSSVLEGFWWLPSAFVYTCAYIWTRLFPFAGGIHESGLIWCNEDEQALSR